MEAERGGAGNPRGIITAMLLPRRQVLVGRSLGVMLRREEEPERQDRHKKERDGTGRHQHKVRRLRGGVGVPPKRREQRESSAPQ